MIKRLLSFALLLPATLAAQGAPVPRFRAAVDLTMGGPDETRDPYLFEDVRGLAFDPQGRIFVSENKANEVRVFSSKGILLLKFGQRGHGPGDFDGAQSLGFDSRGLLWVKDDQNHRYSAFSIGKDRATPSQIITLPTNFSYGNEDRVSWDEAGHLVHVTGMPFLKGAPNGEIRQFLDNKGMLIRSDTIAKAPAESVKIITHLVPGPKGAFSSSGAGQPFGPYQLLAFGPRGEMAEAISSRYAIGWSDASHHRIALIQRDLAGPALSEKERASAAATIAAIEKRWGESFPLGVPDRKPPLAALGFDLDGRLWVELTTTPGQTHQADVYDRSHRLVATMEWPANVRLPGWTVKGMTALGVARDSLGTQTVVRLQFKAAKP